LKRTTKKRGKGKRGPTFALALIHFAWGIFLTGQPGPQFGKTPEKPVNNSHGNTTRNLPGFLVPAGRGGPGPRAGGPPGGDEKGGPGARPNNPSPFPTKKNRKAPPGGPNSPFHPGRPWLATKGSPRRGKGLDSFLPTQGKTVKGLEAGICFSAAARIRGVFEIGIEGNSRAWAGPIPHTGLLGPGSPGPPGPVIRQTLPRPRPSETSNRLGPELGPRPKEKSGTVPRGPWAAPTRFFPWPTQPARPTLKNRGPRQRRDGAWERAAFQLGRGRRVPSGLSLENGAKKACSLGKIPLGPAPGVCSFTKPVNGFYGPRLNLHSPFVPCREMGKTPGKLGWGEAWPSPWPGRPPRPGDPQHKNRPCVGVG